MARMAILVSPELCIGCRACQTACKAWNELPGDQTSTTGNFDSPADLTPNLYNKIRYVEAASDRAPLRWLFVSQRCMHCGDAACMKICPAAGALYKTAEGAVAYDKDKCVGCKLCASACPFNVPRYDAQNKIAKCDLCSERLAQGLLPACAKTCPTGALRFGDRDALVASAQQAGYRKVYGQSDLGGLGAIYAFRDEPKLYGMNENPALPETLVFWHNVLKPMTYLGLGGVVAASLLHYAVLGPKQDKEEEVENNG